MYGLTKLQKLKFILETLAENKISAYEISKNTKLTEAGVSRIIRKVAKNPHESSLDQILEFLIDKNLAKELISYQKDQVSEKEEIYSKAIMKEVNNNPLVICLNEKNVLTMEVLKLQNLLRKNNIPFVDIFNEDGE